jgi:hypothetical protein
MTFRISNFPPLSHYQLTNLSRVQSSMAMNATSRTSRDCVYPLAFCHTLTALKLPLGYSISIGNHSATLMSPRSRQSGRQEPRIRYVVATCLTIFLVTQCALVLPRHTRAHQNDSVMKYMSKFKRNASHPYSLITPDTPLAELAEFLRHNIFALGEPTKRDILFGPN